MEEAKFPSLTLLGVASLVRFSPARKIRALLLAEAAADVLTELGLCNSNLPARFAANPDSFEIRLGDLTPEGMAFARKGFQRWLRNTDRWPVDRSVEKFKSALRLQWARAPR
jgi:hypothetical protein